MNTADRFIVKTFQVPGTEHSLVYNLFLPEIFLEEQAQECCRKKNGPGGGRLTVSDNEVVCDQVTEDGKSETSGKDRRMLCDGTGLSLSRFPLVLFIHDWGSCSEDPRRTLTQGHGATVWAEPENQKAHPCFVLAPVYPEQAAWDDYRVGWEADATIALIRALMEEYPIDSRRIYGTGQSMGCMMLCELNLRYPGFFGGCFLVAGQWNPETMGAAKDANLWILVSEKDPRAFPIMGTCVDAMEANGGRVTRGAIDGNAPADIQNVMARSLMAKGNSIIFSWFSGDSALSCPKEVPPYFYHMATWGKAYEISAIRDWLFAQSSSPIDFSCKHEIFIRSEDGTLTPMDQPWFEARQVAPGTWQILSDGDYSYLVEGEDQALVIDSGYGCGNIRAFCQSLTDRPVNFIASTHHHFDHTANNSYFDLTYLSAETRELATIPFPSFSGITFPRDYPVCVVDEGDVIRLGGRNLTVFKIPDHTAGGLAFLDDREGILFCGDEMTMPFGKPVDGTVERFREHLRRLQAHREDIRLICGGPGIADAGLIDRLAENMDYILSGHEGRAMEARAEKKPQGEPGSPEEPAPDQKAQGEDGQLMEAEVGKKVQSAPGKLEESAPGQKMTVEEGNALSGETVIYDRKLPHTPDRHHDDPEEQQWKRVMDYAGCRVIYDVRRVYEP